MNQYDYIEAVLKALNRGLVSRKQKPMTFMERGKVIRDLMRINREVKGVPNK